MSILGNPIIVALNPNKLIPSFSYSGNYRFRYEELQDGTYNWELALLSGNNINLNFTQVTDKIDIFICGSGADGTKGYSSQTYSNYAYGGNGGNGGELKNLYNVSIAKNTNYAVKIGNHGEITSITIGGTTYSCSSGGGKTGGAGAAVLGNAYGGTASAENGKNGVIAFSDATNSNNRDTKLLGWNGYRYGASGGGGAAKNALNIVRGNGSGGLGNVSGTAGGGAGGMWDSYGANGDGKNGVGNSGGGGGGGAYIQETYSYTDFPAGHGGSGIIIIRNHRS